MQVSVVLRLYVFYVVCHETFFKPSCKCLVELIGIDESVRVRFAQTKSLAILDSAGSLNTFLRSFISNSRSAQQSRYIKSGH